MQREKAGLLPHNRESPRHSREATKVASDASLNRRVRFAVVGLGHIAQSAVLPAFSRAKRSTELAALVSGDETKLKELGGRYNVKALCDYTNLSRCLREESIDAVYIATPNTEHVGLVCEAAAAGVHVLCEKPLGVSEQECLEMIDACEQGGVHLMTAYRLHFEAANLKALEIAHSGRIGEPRIFTSAFTYQIKDLENIRLRGALGGGPLQDIGIYCINAARSFFRSEPTEVQAWSLSSGDPRFREVDETVSVHMRFPGERVATFVCSFGVATSGWYQVIGTKGDIRLDPAYEHAEGLNMRVTVDEKSKEHAYVKRDQFAAELVYFADCVLNDAAPQPSGWEGLADVRTIRALQQSIQRGVALTMPPPLQVRYPTPSQRIDRPPSKRRTKLVHARPASG